MKRIAFIVNGKIRSKEKLFENIRRIFTGDYKVQFFITEKAGATFITTQAVIEGFYYVICIGGDGSLNEVVNGVMNAKPQISEREFKELRLGVLPYGSGNDFAKTIGVSFNLVQLKSWIDDGQYNELDLGLVSFKNVRGKDDIRYFINITDLGLGAIVSKRVNASSKLFGASFSYQWAILRSFVTYRLQPISVKTDATTYEGKVMNYIIANGKYFGSGLGIAPDAKPNDGEFSIVIVGSVSLPFYLKSLSDIKKCNRIIHPEVHYQSAKIIEADSLEKKQPIDMDGEFIGYAPMRVVMTPKAIKFLCARLG